MALTYRKVKTNMFATSPDEVETMPAPAQSPKDWTRLRKANPLNQLLPVTRRWMETLPDSIRPIELIRLYPRIANRIAHSWHDPRVLHEVFNELMIDQRGGRKGFPAPILAELLLLREFVDGAHSTSFHP